MVSRYFKVKMKILFVCIGKRCCSPMAEGYLKEILKEEGSTGKIEVSSAGILVLSEKMYKTIEQGCKGIFSLLIGRSIYEVTI